MRISFSLLGLNDEKDAKNSLQTFLISLGALFTDCISYPEDEESVYKEYLKFEGEKFKEGYLNFLEYIKYNKKEDKIFSRNLFFTKNKQTRFLYLNQKLYTSFLVAASFYQPLLTLNENILKSKSVGNEDFEDFQIDYMQDESIFENTNSFKLKFLDKDLEEVISKYPTQFCIQDDFYNYFLEYVTHIYLKYRIITMNMKLNDKLNDDLFTFLSIYNIDFEKWYINLDGVSKQMLIKIMSFGVDISNIQHDFDLVKDIKLKLYIHWKQHEDAVNQLKELKKNKFADEKEIKRLEDINKISLNSWRKFKMLQKIYRRVFGYKVGLKGLLNSLDVYKNFGFFYGQQFLKYIGRIFYRGWFLNMQTFLFSKSFIRYRVNPQANINENNFQKVKLVFEKVLNINLENLNYLEFQQKQKEFTLQYINSFFNFKLDFNEVSQLNLNELFSFVKKGIKNTREFLLGVSLLFELRNPSPFFEFMYEKDASASGYQHISIFYRNITLASYVNIAGSDMTDIYSLFPIIYHKIIGEINLIYNNFKEYYKVSELSSINIIDSPDNISNILNGIFSINNNNLSFEKTKVNNYIKSLLDLIKLKDVNKVFILDKNFLQDCLWLIPDPKDRIEVLKKLKNENSLDLFKVLLLVLKGFIYYKNLFKFNPWIFNLINRDMFKKPVMVFAYNISRKGMEKKLAEFILTKALELGIENTNISEKDEIVLFLTRFFYNVKDKYLQIPTHYLTLGYNVAKSFEPIIKMQTPFIQWSYEPNLIDPKRIYIKYISKKRSMRMRVTFKNPTLDIKNPITRADFIAQKFYKKECTNTLSPSFVHSSDSIVAHDFVKDCFLLNKYLREEKIIFNYWINHDNFSISNNFNYFLEMIVRKNYLTVYKFDYLKRFLNTFEDSLWKHKFIKKFCKLGDPDYLNETDIREKGFIK